LGEHGIVIKLASIRATIKIVETRDDANQLEKLELGHYVDISRRLPTINEIGPTKDVNDLRDQNLEGPTYGPYDEV
jgi:hypothetical protein